MSRTPRATADRRARPPMPHFHARRGPDQRSATPGMRAIPSRNVPQAEIDSTPPPLSDAASWTRRARRAAPSRRADHEDVRSRVVPCALRSTAVSSSSVSTAGSCASQVSAYCLKRANDGVASRLASQPCERREHGQIDFAGPVLLDALPAPDAHPVTRVEPSQERFHQQDRERLGRQVEQQLATPRAPGFPLEANRGAIVGPPVGHPNPSAFPEYPLVFARTSAPHRRLSPGTWLVDPTDFTGRR